LPGTLTVASPTTRRPVRHPPARESGQGHFNAIGLNGVLKLTKPVLGLILAIVAIVLVLVMIVVTYNGLVNAEQNVDAQWAQVENEYQRKIDLIPNLVNITSEYTQFEKSTLENITKLRMDWLSALTSDPTESTKMAMTASS
jgi:hypothetical protein